MGKELKLTKEELQKDCIEPMVRAFADNISVEGCSCDECTRIRDKWETFYKAQAKRKKVYDSIRRVYPNYKPYGITLKIQPFEAYHG